MRPRFFKLNLYTKKQTDVLLIFLEPSRHIFTRMYNNKKHPSLKVKEVYGQTYDMRQEAKSSLFEYIEIFYNRKRRHSYLGLVSPKDFEYMYNQKTYENAA